MTDSNAYAESQRCRPSVLFRPELRLSSSHEGAKAFWHARYGDIYAQGETADEAMRKFDDAWEHLKNPWTEERNDS
jgi:hypothetical protein